MALEQGSQYSKRSGKIDLGGGEVINVSYKLRAICIQVSKSKWRRYYLQSRERPVAGNVLFEDPGILLDCTVAFG